MKSRLLPAVLLLLALATPAVAQIEEVRIGVNGMT